MLEIGDLVTLDNGKEYVVANVATIDNTNYVYLITEDGISDVLICLVKDNSLVRVKDGEILEKLLNIFKDGVDI